MLTHTATDDPSHGWATCIWHHPLRGLGTRPEVCPHVGVGGERRGSMCAALAIRDDNYTQPVPSLHRWEGE